jgi:hypothetical protein
MTEAMVSDICGALIIIVAICAGAYVWTRD